MVTVCNEEEATRIDREKPGIIQLLLDLRLTAINVGRLARLLTVLSTVLHENTQRAACPFVKASKGSCTLFKGRESKEIDKMAKKKPPKGSTMVASKGNAQNGKGARKVGTPNQQSRGISGASGQKMNPFERMWNRRKFDVLGKKTKGEQRKVGQSRSRAVEMVCYFLGLFLSQSRHCCPFVMHVL